MPSLYGDENSDNEIEIGNYRVIYKMENHEISVLTVRHVKQVLSIEELAK